MNVANLELCKELYELSGWDLDDYWFLWEDTYGIDLHEYGHVVKPKTTIPTGRGRKIVPAYDLGYLLRKLPKGSYIQVGKTGRCTASTGNAFHTEAPWVVYKEHGDTPEDAAAKLCIELIKQDILKGKEV